MRKLLEIEVNDDYRKSLFVHYALTVLIFSLFLLVRTFERSFIDIDFYVEFIFLFMVLRFYSRSHRNKNYAFWGLTVILGLYLLKNILYFTFINYNIFILYFAFLAGLFLVINSYIMSSPLYYPRVQWWEYDFRFSGELKVTAKVGEIDFEGRMADLRRNATSILAFNQLKLGDKMEVEIPYGNKVFKISGVIKTAREVIPGRPIRYGVILDEKSENQKLEIIELKKIWKLHHKANLRRKFAAQKEANGL